MLKKVVLFLLIMVSVQATEYHVNSDGSGDYTSIQQAADAASAGDTVYIHAGTYSGFSASNSGYASNYITFRNFENDIVIINAQGASAISIQNKDYLQFIGLNLVGGNTASFYVRGPATNLILDGLTISDCGKGIQFIAGSSTISDSTIKNCDISQTTDTCINLYQHNTNILIDNNHLSYCSPQRTAGEPDGIQINVWDGDGQGPNGITITNNEIEHAGRQGLMTWNAINLLVKDNHFHHCGASGIQIEDGAINVVVDGNINEYNAQHYETETGVWIDNTENAVVQNNILRHNKIGLLISKSDQVIVRNNLVYENDISAQDPAGITSVKYDGVSNTNNIIVHNSVYRNGQSGNHGGGISLGAWGTMESAVIKNNIASESNSESDLYVKCQSYKADYNNYYCASALRINVNDNTMSWDQYKLQTGQDSNSINQNPLFVDPLSGDFTLQLGSPCIDAGGPLTTTVSSGSGTSLVVDNARYFTDGFGLVDGDLIQVGSNEPVRVTGVNYDSNILTLSQSISWDSWDAVNYAYSGNGPDMGAFESGMSSQPYCGDGTCDAGETNGNCPADCPPNGAVCGNSQCDSDECNTCPDDCGLSDCCPDGDCNNNENCSTCSGDCGNCTVDCIHEADQEPCDGCIDTVELSAYLSLWKSGSVEMAELMSAITLWKNS